MATPLRAEQDWARAHPVPESTTQDIVLSLWNYPVAKSDLTPEHRAALAKFLEFDFLALGSSREPPADLYLRGHASDSGDEAANITLSRNRAEKVRNYLVSAGFPARKVNVEFAGSEEPADPGSSGLAAARNRRVDVLRFAPSLPEPLPPVDKIELPPKPVPAPPQPTFKLPAPTLSGVSYERVIPIDFPTYRGPNYSIGGKIEVTFKGKVTDRGDGVTGGVAVKPGGGLGAKAEAEIADHIKAKIGVDVDGQKPGITFKGGLEFSDVRLKPEIGLQTKDTFIYVNLTLVDRPFPDFDVEGLHVSGTITIKGKIEFAPGPALVLRFGAIVSPIVVAALIIGATVYGIEAATAEQIRFARLVAAREGISARIAYEIVGTAAEAQFTDRRGDWKRTEGGLESDFIAGVNAINDLLNTPEARTAWTTEWKKKYAADNNADFTTLRGRAFDDVGGYEPEGTLDTAMTKAVGG